MVQAILKELDERKSYLPSKKIDTIYFGGGTPSILNSEELASIFETLNTHFVWDNNCEITLEANPDDINNEVLKEWLNVGINRLSIGLQSFNNEELKWMNRAHTAEESTACVKKAQDAGFYNISIDLIYGSKFQDLRSWEITLQRAISLQPQHISAYNLTIEGKTSLNQALKKGIEPHIDDDLSSKQLLTMLAFLSTHGFEQYEISNFAQSGYTAKHNTNYWFQKPYLGIGPSAHSYNGQSRQWNIKNNAIYIQNLNKQETYFEIENLNKNDLYNEYLLTRLRTKWGIEETDFEHKFGKKRLEEFKTELIQKDKYINYHNGFISFNQAGKLLADKIVSDLFRL